MQLLEKTTAIFPALKFIYQAIQTSLKRIEDSNNNFGNQALITSSIEIKSRAYFLFVLLLEILLYFFYFHAFADCEDSKLLQLCYLHSFFLFMYSALRYIQDIIPNFTKTQDEVSISSSSTNLPQFENENPSLIPKNKNLSIQSFSYGYTSRMVVLLFFCMYAYSFFFSILVAFDGFKSVITIFGHDSKKESKLYNAEIDYFWKLIWVLIPTLIINTWGASQISASLFNPNAFANPKEAKKPATGLTAVLSFLFPKLFNTNTSKLAMMKQRASGETFQDVIFNLISNYFSRFNNESQKRTKSSISDTNSSAMTGTSPSSGQMDTEALNKTKLKSEQLRFDFSIFILPYLSTLIAGCVMSAILRNTSGETRVIIDFMTVLGVSVMVSSAIVPKIKDCGLILLQTVPNDMKGIISKKLREVNSIEGILELSEFHCWTQTFGNNNLIATAKFRVAKDSDEFSVTQKVKALFAPFISDISVQVVKETL